MVQMLPYGWNLTHLNGEHRVIRGGLYRQMGAIQGVRNHYWINDNPQHAFFQKRVLAPLQYVMIDVDRQQPELKLLQPRSTVKATPGTHFLVRWLAAGSGLTRLASPLTTTCTPPRSWSAPRTTTHSRVSARSAYP